MISKTKGFRGTLFSTHFFRNSTPGCRSSCPGHSWSNWLQGPSCGRLRRGRSCKAGLAASIFSDIIYLLYHIYIYTLYIYTLYIYTIYIYTYIHTTYYIYIYIHTILIYIIYVWMYLSLCLATSILAGDLSDIPAPESRNCGRTSALHGCLPLKKRCQVTMQRFTWNILKPVFSVPKNLGNLSKSHTVSEDMRNCDCQAFVISLGLRWLNPWSKLFPVAPGSNDRVIPSAQSKMASMNGSQRKEEQFEVTAAGVMLMLLPTTMVTWRLQASMASCSIGVALVDPDVLLLQRKRLLRLLPHSTSAPNSSEIYCHTATEMNEKYVYVYVCVYIYIHTYKMANLIICNSFFSTRWVFYDHPNPPTRSWVSSSEMLPRCLFGMLHYTTRRKPAWKVWNQRFVQQG